MPWLWESWDEYVKYVSPALVYSRGMFGNSIRCSSFGVSNDLFETHQELSAVFDKLVELGFTVNRSPKPPKDSATIEEAKAHVTDLIFHGEELLLYHKRLARSQSAYGFLSQHELLEHWDRYEASGRIANEICQLIKDTSDLLDGYRAIIQEDENFLVNGLDLPTDLESDFRTARNLFSLGFEEIGLLIAGRGLEGVLRQIARLKKVKIDAKGKVEEAWDSDFKDLTEVMYRLRWKVTGNRLISARTKALLDFLRTIRNQGAHTNSNEEDTGLRESAALVAKTANNLWRTASTTRTRFNETIIKKSW